MNCLHCNKPIEGKRNTKKYCGNTCKQYAYLNRNFGIPSNLNAITLINHETSSNEQKNDGAVSNGGNNSERNNQYQNINSINLKPTSNHEYKKPITEQEYQYINADILDRIQNGYISLNITSSYFSNSSKNGGRITEQNSSAFSYILPRLRCIVENLFQLTYKRKLYYRTVITICKGIEEILLSDQIKTLPGDFPFIVDLIKLHEQFTPMANYLENDKDGIKFRLTKAAIVRYILILCLIRDRTTKEPFNKLFPELYKITTQTKPNKRAV